MSRRRLEERTQRIAILARENAGRKEEASFLQALGEVVGVGIRNDRLFELRETDTFVDEFTKRYHDAIADRGISHKRSFSNHDADRMFMMLDCIGKMIGDDYVVFLAKKSEICGGARLSPHRAFSNLRGLVALDGDSVVFISPDRTQGLLLDWRREEPLAAYDLTVWGDHWSAAALECEIESTK